MCPRSKPISLSVGGTETGSGDCWNRAYVLNAMSTKTGCVLCLEGFEEDTDAERPIVFNDGGTDLGASNSGREVNIQGVEGSTATTET